MPPTKAKRVRRPAPLRSLCRPLPAPKPLPNPVGNKEVAELLEEILSHQLANRGTNCEFFRCYTYNAREMPEWVKKAERTLATLKVQL